MDVITDRDREFLNDVRIALFEPISVKSDTLRATGRFADIQCERAEQANKRAEKWRKRWIWIFGALLVAMVVIEVLLVRAI